MSPFTKVKNAEPSVPKTKGMFEVETLVIRSAMDKKSRHTLNGGSVGWSKGPKIVHTCKTTHFNRSPISKMWNCSLSRKTVCCRSVWDPKSCKNCFG